MSDDDGRVSFAISEAEPRDFFAIHIVVLHRLACRASLRDLDRILQRLALRPSERLSVVLNVAPTCSKAVVKSGTRLCSRHNLCRHSTERPLVAVSQALEGVSMHALDQIVVLEGVLPNTGFIPSLVAGVSAADADVLILTPPSCRTIVATAGFLHQFAEKSPVLAGHPDADLLMACFYNGGDPTRGPRELRSCETGDFLVQPLQSVVGPEVTSFDVAVLNCVLTRLGLHADQQQLLLLEQAAAEARCRLRRAVAAHWRDDVDEDDAIHEILNAAFTGILPHCKWYGKSSAPSVIPAIYLEYGIREAAIDLGMRADGNPAFRCALIHEFPEIKERVEEIKRRAVQAIIRRPMLHGDNVRLGRRGQAT